MSTHTQSSIVNKLVTSLTSKNYKFWLTLFLFSCFTIFAMGRLGADILVYGLWLYLSLYVIRRFSNKFFIVYSALTFIASAVYLPIAIMYGKMDKGVVASLFETNLQESMEFMSMVSGKSYIFVIAYIALFIYLLKQNMKVEIDTKKGKGLYVLAVVIFLSIFGRPLVDMVKQKGFYLRQLNYVNYYPLRQVIEFNYRSEEYFQNKEMLKKARTLDPVWDFADKELKYNTYVLVIGESMRRDYMSAYGFPTDTTPFLAKANGVFFDNYVAPSQNTKLSLERMLFQNTAPEKSIMSNTPVTLASSLGMGTYWLSNQGVYGNFDVFATSVAVRSDEMLFLKKGQTSTVNHSDLEMLPKFKEILKNDDSRKKLIVLHLYGSHSKFCSRLDPNYGIENITGYGSEALSCYLSTFRQTDKLLENIYNELKQTDKNFSLMYVSDHGLIHKEQPLQGMTLRHNTKYKEDYEVPLLTLSSDDTQRTHITANRSGYYFMNAFAEWFGVKENTLVLEPQFFSDKSYNKPIKVFNGSKVIDFETLRDDPAIIIE